MKDLQYYRKYEPIFGNWNISGEIGAGSYGKVFLITRKDFGGFYNAALKAITIPADENELNSLINSEGMTEENASTYYREVVEEFSKEFSLMSKLKGNTNIVSYEDHQVIRHSDGIGWDILIRMELLTPLTQVLKQRLPDEDEVVRLGIDICTALEICGKKSIIHRDIKPENIFLSDNNDYKLGDFGVARISERTMASTHVGSINYIAPEIEHGEKYDSRVDIYSLGIVMYRLLNGNRLPFLSPFQEAVSYIDSRTALNRRLRGEALPPPAYGDAALQDIVLKACEYLPEKRISSPTEMKNALMKLKRSQVMEDPWKNVGSGNNTGQYKKEPEEEQDDYGNTIITGKNIEENFGQSGESDINYYVYYKKRRTQIGKIKK